MMNNERNELMKKLLLFCILFLMSAVPAVAQTDAKADTDTEPAVIVEVQATPAPVTFENGQPFSVPGNGEVVDDITDNSKEFYIITTANNNTFYLVIDKATTSQNVYMLSKVDENDLAEFIEGSAKVDPTPTPAPAVIIQKPTSTPVPTEVQQSAEAGKNTEQNDSTMLFVILGATIIGGIVYFKVIKPKKQKVEEDKEDIETMDEE